MLTLGCCFFCLYSFFQSEGKKCRKNIANFHFWRLKILFRIQFEGCPSLEGGECLLTLTFQTIIEVIHYQFGEIQFQILKHHLRFGKYILGGGDWLLTLTFKTIIGAIQFTMIWRNTFLNLEYH